MAARILPLSLMLAAAFAQPHGHPLRNRYHRRATITNVVTVVETAPAAVVMVNQYGKVLYTSHLESATGTTNHATPTHTPEKSVEHDSAAQQQAQHATPDTSTTTASRTFATSTAADATTSSSQPSSSLSSYGISYAPYNDDGTCRTADDILADFADLKVFGYVRSYGVDCNQVPNLLQAAKANGVKVMLGIYNIDQYAAELATLIAGVEANGGWALVHSVSIGNEDINAGRSDLGSVISATNNGRAQLRAAGYTGPVVHVDVFNQYLAHPELCDISDYVAANCHAFFDPNTSAPDAGSFVKNQVQQLKNTCAGKSVHITESGWPNKGEANGNAVPSAENQQAALDSLTDALDGNLVLFSAYNDYWKKNGAGTFGAEQYWGIFGPGTSVEGY